MNKRTAILFLVLCSVLYGKAEDSIPLTYNSFMLGIGSARAYDTYLSPLEYKGSNVSFSFEQMRPTDLVEGKIAAQHLINLELASTENPAGNANNYFGNLEYSYGLFYRFAPIPKLRLFAGAQVDGLAGFIYNSRNGNNPATPKLNFNLNLSGIASYRFDINEQPILLRYQLNLPFVGTLYSSRFGQSYYEMDLDDYDGIFHFASFHNQIMMRNTLSVELPFNSAYSLRLAYMNNFYETRINDLDTRIITNSFFIGFSYNIFPVSAKKSLSSPYQNIFQ